VADRDPERLKNYVEMLKAAHGGSASRSYLPAGFGVALTHAAEMRPTEKAQIVAANNRARNKRSMQNFDLPLSIVRPTDCAAFGIDVRERTEQIFYHPRIVHAIRPCRRRQDLVGVSGENVRRPGPHGLAVAVLPL
jgi:hypothetical protein